MATSTSKPVVVIPNLNGESELRACIDSVLRGTLQPHLIVVDNGSVDGSVALIQQNYPTVELIRHIRNLGYAGGVNPGFRRALELGAQYVAPFNNDAVADPHWLETLVHYLDTHPEVGVASSKVVSADGSRLDTTGDQYTTWGLPYPRGRDEPDNKQYDDKTDIFSASGAASLYRVDMLRQIGLLDEDFFAYYEDVDLSFRAQLAGYKIAYVPGAVVYHATSTTGRRMVKGFFTYQTMKNLPMLFYKNVPCSLWPTILPRFTLAYCSFFVSALQRGQFGSALRGAGRAFCLGPRKCRQRRAIQRSRTVPDSYVRSMLLWDLPPNAARLRKLRSAWWKLTGKREGKAA